MHIWRVGVCDRPNLTWVFKFEMHIDGSFLLISGGASRLHHPKFVANVNLPMCKVECCGSSDSSLGGEKIIFAMLYTHTRCLQMMYVVAHVCESDLG